MFVALLAASVLAASPPAGPGLAGARARPRPSSADTSLSRAVAQADSLISAAIADSLVPGAVLLVARDGKVVHQRAFGVRQLYAYPMRRLEEPPPMRVSTVFDLASVTKVMATTMAVMLLVDRGKVDLDAPLYRYLPEFRGPHRDSIRVRHLLQHSAGLVQWQPLYYHASTPAETYAEIRRIPLRWGVGEGRHYSDLGFMLLGFMVERVTGQRLDAFLRANLYDPLGLRSTGFRPRGPHGAAWALGARDFAATEQGNGYERHMVYDSAFGYYVPGDPHSWDGWRRRTLVGEVDDGNAWYANGGVAGHAGLFSDAADLRVLLRLLLDGGTYGGRRYLKQATIRTFLARDRYGNYLGWEDPADTPPGTFSHNGFTGTYVLAIPASGVAVVLLTNRQNAGTDARGYFPDVGPLQRAVTQVMAAVR